MGLPTVTRSTGLQSPLGAPLSQKRIPYSRVSAVLATSNARSSSYRIWSAVIRHRFCGFGDSSPKPGRVQRPREEVGRLLAFDGDESPAESADKSAHSKARGAAQVAPDCERTVTAL